MIDDYYGNDTIMLDSDGYGDDDKTTVTMMTMATMMMMTVNANDSGDNDDKPTM